MWLFNEESKNKYGKQKKKGFVEAMVEIETNPDIALEMRCREKMPIVKSPKNNFPILNEILN